MLLETNSLHSTSEIRVSFWRLQVPLLFWGKYSWILRLSTSAKCTLTSIQGSRRGVLNHHTPEQGAHNHNWADSFRRGYSEVKRVTSSQDFKSSSLRRIHAYLFRFVQDTLLDSVFGFGVMPTRLTSSCWSCRPQMEGLRKAIFTTQMLQKLKVVPEPLFRGPTKKLSTSFEVTKVTFLGSFPNERQDTLTLDFDPLKILQ